MRQIFRSDAGAAHQELSRALRRSDGAAFLTARLSSERTRYLEALPALFDEERERSRRNRFLSIALCVAAGLATIAAAAIGDGGLGLLFLAAFGGVLLLAPLTTRRWQNLIFLASRLVEGHQHGEDAEALLAVAVAIGEIPDGPSERLLLDSLRESLVHTLDFLSADAPLSPRAIDRLAALVDAGVREYVGYSATSTSLGAFLIAGLLALDSRNDPRARSLAEVLKEAVREHRLQEAVRECLREPGNPTAP